MFGVDFFFADLCVLTLKSSSVKHIDVTFTCENRES